MMTPKELKRQKIGQPGITRILSPNILIATVARLTVEKFSIARICVKFASVAGKNLCKIARLAMHMPAIN